MGYWNEKKKFKDPRFPIELWNVYYLVEKKMAWNRGFSELMHAHPSIFQFLKKSHTEQAKNELKLAQILSGGAPEPKKKCYKELALRLEIVALNFSTYQNPILYLKSISHNLISNM